MRDPGNEVASKQSNYNFTLPLVCVSEMGDTAGFFSLKAQFIPLGITFNTEAVSNNFGSFQFEKGESRWKQLQNTGTITQLILWIEFFFTT